MSAWNNISKPSASNWSDEHPQGKEQYDESTITYDDADIYYDGLNPNQWTDVAKPTNGATIRVGMLTLLPMPVTYSREWSVGSWIKVLKPNTP